MDTDELASLVELVLDRETHEQLCACDDFPGTCVTYGDQIPWSHSDVHHIVATTVHVQESPRVG